VVARRRRPHRGRHRADQALGGVRAGVVRRPEQEPVPPGQASALSALNTTGPLVAQAVAVAAIGGIYLTYGLAWALGTTAAVLVVGAGCAALSR
jgi:hypothetical protein